MTAMCECGRGPVEIDGRRASTGGCKACNDADGRGPRQAEVIAILRLYASGRTTAELAAELGLKHNSAAMLLDRMVKAGYLVKRRDPTRASIDVVREEFFGMRCKPKQRPLTTPTVYHLARRAS